MTPFESDPTAAPLSVQLGAMTATRTAINTSYRMVYPFLPVLARGMGVSLTTAALIVTARSLVGLVSPLLGSMADVWGRRISILIALVVVAAGMLAITLWPIFAVVLLGLVIASIGKFTFEPAMQAYLSDRVVYARRGLVIAITEVAWSGAYLVGIPLIGLLIAAYGWSAPFPWIGGAVIIGAALLWRILPADQPHASQRPSVASSARIVFGHRAALAAMLFGLLIVAGNETISIVYGQWMEDAFGLQVAALGLASTVIGVSELAGEGLVASLVDRMGKRRGVVGGLVLNIAVLLILPLVGQTLVGALIGLFLLYMTFEFSVVSALPLLTELVPGARATMMAGSAAAFATGRALGALAGPQLYLHGLQMNSFVAAGLNAVAIGLLWTFVKID